MKLAFPEYWLWWLGLPVSLGIIYLVYKRSDQVIKAWFSREQYARSFPRAKMAIRMLGFVLLFVALLGPYGQNQEREVPRMGREIYFLLDVSRSMNATDLRPSRLEKMRRELNRLVAKMEGDRVGLIAFTDVAYVMCPLTEDMAAVSTYLGMVQTSQYAQTGTQFRAAFFAALDRFLDEAEEEKMEPRARVAVLISDGEDFGDTYVSLIQRLQQANVTVFTVGVGTSEGAPVPADPADPAAGFLRSEDGQLVISALAPGALQQIADEFGTEYVSISDERDHLEELERQLYALSASPLERNLQAVAGNQFQLLLFPAIILLLGSMFLMPIRKE